MLAAAATRNLNFFFPDLATDDFDKGKRDNLLFFFQLYPLKATEKEHFIFVSSGWLLC